jgi:hypothetical protein
MPLIMRNGERLLDDGRIGFAKGRIYSTVG